MEIAEIKARLSIQTVLSHYGLKVNQSNMLCCPFHADKTPSMQIYPKTNTAYCFSTACRLHGKKLDVIDLIQEHEQLTQHRAILKAQQMIEPTQPPSDTSDERKNAGIPHEGKALSRTAVLTKFYQSCLQGMTRSLKAQQYAQDRQLNYEYLGIGFISADFGRSWNDPLKQSAVKLGLMQERKGKIVPKLRSCLMLPMKNAAGKVVDIYARSLQDDSYPRHFYLPQGQQGLYPHYPKPETERLVLTESLLDAATLLQDKSLSQVYGMLALYGTNGFTKEHEQAIQGLANLQEIIFFLDGDEAGRKAVAKYADQLQALRPDVKLTAVATPEGEDVNSLLQGHTPVILEHLLNERQAIGSPTLFLSSEKTPEASPVAPPLTDDSAATQPPSEETSPSSEYRLHTENTELLFFTSPWLQVTVLGGIKIAGLDRLRVTVKVEPAQATPGKRHLPVRHSLDLYHSGQVQQLVIQVAERLEVSSREAMYTLSELTASLERYRHRRLEALQPKAEEKPTLSGAEKQAALDYLQSPQLLTRLSSDIRATGLIGEETNALIAYLVYTSRKRESPLHLMCLGQSGTGKTYLQEKVSALMPEEERLEITTLSENAFYYFQREELKGKLILIEDLDGAEGVLYPLRELQSKKRISKTVTLKDNKGNLKTVSLRVEGPVSVSGCTTREKLYEDNANRCLLLYVDQSDTQDGQIMAYQRKLSAGLVNAGEQHTLIHQLQNVQRLLRPIKIVNPYAELIQLPPQVFKPRRTMLLLLSFIETVTFLHQYQREVKQDATGTPYLQTAPDDVAAAFRLLREVLFAKSDELTQASRSFLEQLTAYTKEQNRETFYARHVRKHLRLNPNNLKRYLRELVSYGQVKIVGGSRHKGFEYQIVAPKEYEGLKSAIDEQLAAILLKINESVGQ
ncbi:CHC2 zinc finger domain-containing protein [Tunicatimonas pelagia]|uniref:CHC2 zinc finger domain-containing protein n=1 Tax=Tunicatimonas pelagia TaxID=931531 RepID=UPI0026661381|nr:CHC2 zinc finger domain-containing protein [Tunicatimonas pelagia]WKN45301.1 CHC2 zinc finger domain-containing protein [Tunicatimonas pelagia]WKN45310.1 CHC2 zinc finger domain-containing protein [Tunicatimonas pelagia]